VQAFVDTVMPKEHSVRLTKADVRYLQEAFTTAKEGVVKTAKEAAVEAAIWVAVRKRKNGEAYEVKSGAKCHKEAKPKKSITTEATEEKMSKIPERVEAQAVLSAEKKSA